MREIIVGELYIVKSRPGEIFKVTEFNKDVGYGKGDFLESKKEEKPNDFGYFFITEDLDASLGVEDLE